MLVRRIFSVKMAPPHPLPHHGRMKRHFVAPCLRVPWDSFAAKAKQLPVLRMSFLMLEKTGTPIRGRQHACPYKRVGRSIFPFFTK